MVAQDDAAQRFCPRSQFRRETRILGNDAARGWTSEVQLEAMDIEGIDVAVLYPTRGLRALVDDRMDPAFAAAMARAYNDWMYDFCQKDPTRLIGAGMISPFTWTTPSAKRAVVPSS